MRSGTIKFFDSTKGFGFIVPTEGGDDIFVHISELTYRDIKEGDKVTFDIKQGKKGPAAAKVRLSK